jgi:hypothetical protein
MFLVEIHARIISVAPPLLERTMHTLVSDVVQEALACFRQIKRFGMGGMLKVSSFIAKTSASTLTFEYLGDSRNRVHAPNLGSVRDTFSQRNVDGYLSNDIGRLLSESGPRSTTERAPARTRRCQEDTPGQSGGHENTFSVLQSTQKGRQREG